MTSNFQNSLFQSSIFHSPRTFRKGRSQKQQTMMQRSSIHLRDGCWWERRFTLKCLLLKSAYLIYCYYCPEALFEIVSNVGRSYTHRWSRYVSDDVSLHKWHMAWSPLSLGARSRIYQTFWSRLMQSQCSQKYSITDHILMDMLSNWGVGKPNEKKQNKFSIKWYFIEI